MRYIKQRKTVVIKQEVIRKIKGKGEYDMPCRSCLVLELEFEIQLMSKENQTVIPSIQ